MLSSYANGPTPLGKSFQEQWMGTMIPFPLTIQVLQDLEGIFQSLKDKSLWGLSRKSGRRQQSSYWTLFINPQKQGQGIGSQALRKFVSLAFESGDIDSISLNVYEANQTAQHLYQKKDLKSFKWLKHLYENTS